MDMLSLSLSLSSLNHVLWISVTNTANIHVVISQAHMHTLNSVSPVSYATPVFSTRAGFLKQTVLTRMAL